MNATTPNQRVTPYAELARWLSEEACRRRAHIEANMRAEVERIRCSAGQEAAETLRAERSSFEPLGKRVQAEATARAERESAMLVLRAVGDGVDKTIHRCERHLRDLAASDAFASIFERLLLESVTEGKRLRPAASEGAVIGEFLVAATDTVRCRAILERHHIQASVTASPLVWGGTELRVAETPYVIRNTLLSRLHKQETELRRMAAHLLTGALDAEVVHG